MGRSRKSRFEGKPYILIKSGPNKGEKVYPLPGIDIQDLYKRMKRWNEDVSLEGVTDK